MNTQDVLLLARGMGLDAYELDASTLDFRPEVRQMCSADRCGSFGRSWSCPPACGTLEEITARAREFSRGVLVQTVGRLQDEFDYEEMTSSGKRHGQNFRRLVEALDRGEIFPLGMGACTICEKCTYPDAPCRFPERMYPSMEACGLLVSDVCRENGVPYYHGPLTIAYTSCILLR